MESNCESQEARGDGDSHEELSKMTEKPVTVIKDVEAGVPTGIAGDSGVNRNSHSGPDAKQNSIKENMNTSTGTPEDNYEPNVDTDRRGGGGGCGRCRCCTVTLQIYASHFLSSWGDRMWMFAGGFFLLEVTPGSLRLAAVYGAALALTVIVLGAPVGRWVDRTSRLTAAQVSLTIQNIMVCVCAALLVAIVTQRQFFTAWDGWALVVAEVFVILTACVAQVGTLGSKLVIEKDWILILCGKDKTRLARMNSVLRTVDLSTEVFAPVMVGAIMTGFGLAAGGAAIAGWNVASLVVEYGLLHHLYHSNPDLRKAKPRNDALPEEVESTVEGGGAELPNVEEEKRSSRRERVRRGGGRRWGVVERVVAAWGAWRAYMNHPVRDAGLGLSLLFMTVLAFDNYSRAFVYESGVSETVLGILTAVASLFGIFGSLAFPFLRSTIGVTRTGLVGFGSETVCLSLCVASVFAPGSPFDASFIFGPSLDSFSSSSTLSPSFSLMSEVPEHLNFPEPPYVAGNGSSSPDLVVLNWTLADALVGLPSLGDSMLDQADNSSSASDKPANTTDDLITSPDEKEKDYTFVILFLSGIITSRFGLWVADLTVTQILQEGVEETQRGAINGVQSSLNQTLDLLRSILIIILPRRETFGFLVILSFIFVAAAMLMFSVYARKQPKVSSSSMTLETAGKEGEELKAKGEERVELKAVKGLEAEVV